MMKRFEYAHVAEGIARQAGALLRGFYEKGVATEYKGDVDLVTEADRASEALIRERLTAAFPGHGIFGEEGTRDQMESEFRWYVDPLDGTTNFAHGFPVVLRGARAGAAGGWAGCRRGWRDDRGRDLRSAAGRDVFRGARQGRMAEWEADSRVEDEGAAGGADSDGVSFAQAARGRRMCISTRSSRCGRMG